MKKLVLFGALVLTMNFATLGNSVHNEQIIVEEGIDTCSAVAQLAYNLAISEGANHPTAVVVSNLAYNNCKATTN